MARYDVLIDHLKQHFTRMDTRKPLKATGWLRASQAHRLCAREEVISALTNTTRVRKISPTLNLTFKTGTGMHSALQDLILSDETLHLNPAPWNEQTVGLLKGAWRCLECGHRHGGLTQPQLDEYNSLRRDPEVFDQKSWAHARFTALAEAQLASRQARPHACRSCGAKQYKDFPLFRFEEFWFGDPRTRFGGQSDGILDFPWEATEGVLEAKSIADFKSHLIRRVPLADHVIQANINMHLTGLTWALILYWNKGKDGLGALTPYRVEYDADLMQRLADLSDDIFGGIEDGEAPPESTRVCASPSCKRAKGCEVAAQCWTPNWTPPDRSTFDGEDLESEQA